MRRFFLLFLFAVALFFVPILRAGNITVAADVSLRPVLRELLQTYADAQKDPPNVVLNLAPSGIIMREIRKGTPLDVVIASAEGEIQRLAEAKYIVPTSVRALAENRIAVVAAWPDSEPGNDWVSRVRTSWPTIAMPNYENSMAGVAAIALVRKLGMEQELDGRIIFESDSERAFDELRRARVPAAFLFTSDVHRLFPKKSFRVFDLPAQDYPAILYSAAILSKCEETAAAQSLIEFLAAPAQKARWLAHGFLVPDYLQNTPAPAKTSP
jgi:molybdate transport system substrate-binding protein